ncbi:hypothetical protein CYMTET_3050 [Cymbomonas tetramitiformis]|uniref:Glycine transporter domain-containing protein n=1 Tax=Cymbomonas tetramitiformis TaxID=36881 RepID=A0AAE0H477_9CHLO|nr:hypothetical protein CYMTET_3050 [Cymbomonas tetramitiformis]
MRSHAWVACPSDQAITIGFFRFEFKNINASVSTRLGAQFLRLISEKYVMDTQDLFDVVNWFDHFGVAVVAIGGALIAAKRNDDVLAFVFLGCVTGIGGGTVRDIVLGETPVFWVKDTSDLWIAIFFSLLTFVTLSLLSIVDDPHHHIPKALGSFFLWSDNVGLATWSVLGAHKAASKHHGALICVIAGVITACLGGFTRDIFASQKPILFSKEVYAIAPLVGAVVYVIAHHNSLSTVVNFALGFATTFTIRGFGIVFGVTMPHVATVAGILGKVFSKGFSHCREKDDVEAGLLINAHGSSSSLQQEDGFPTSLIQYFEDLPDLHNETFKEQRFRDSVSALVTYLNDPRIGSHLPGLHIDTASKPMLGPVDTPQLMSVVPPNTPNIDCPVQQKASLHSPSRGLQSSSFSARPPLPPRPQ